MSTLECITQVVSSFFKPIGPFSVEGHQGKDLHQRLRVLFNACIDQGLYFAIGRRRKIASICAAKVPYSLAMATSGQNNGLHQRDRIIPFIIVFKELYLVDNRQYWVNMLKKDVYQSRFIRLEPEFKRIMQAFKRASIYSSRTSGTTILR